MGKKKKKNVLIEYISIFQFYKKLNLRIFLKGLIDGRDTAAEFVCRTAVYLLYRMFTTVFRVFNGLLTFW